MMEEFVTKHVPEMTKDIVQLTIERLEKMVREIVLIGGKDDRGRN